MRRPCVGKTAKFMADDTCKWIESTPMGETSANLGRKNRPPVYENSAISSHPLGDDSQREQYIV